MLALAEPVLVLLVIGVVAALAIGVDEVASEKFAVLDPLTRTVASEKKIVEDFQHEGIT